jgi:hypothetical protein
VSQARRVALVPVVVVALTPIVFLVSRCVPARFGEPHPAALRLAQEDAVLARLDSADQSGRIAPDTDACLTRIGVAFAELAEAWLNHRWNGGLGADAIGQGLRDELTAVGIEPLSLSPLGSPRACGESWLVWAWRPSSELVILRLEVGCGLRSDTSVVVLQRRSGRYRVILRDAAPARASIVDFRDRVQVIALPGPRAGEPMIVVGDAMHLPSDTEQRIRVRVLAPSSDPGRPMLVFENQEASQRGGVLADWYQLSATTRGFEVWSFGQAPLGLISSYHVRRQFHVTGTSVRLEGPAAGTPEGFIEEWLATSWDQAGSWTHEAVRRALRDTHDRLAARVRQTLEGVAFGDRWDGDCGPAPERWVVELRFAPDAPHAEKLFFYVTRGDDGFTLERIERGPPAGPWAAAALRCNDQHDREEAERQRIREQWFH